MCWVRSAHKFQTCRSCTVIDSMHSNLLHGLESCSVLSLKSFVGKKWGSQCTWQQFQQQQMPKWEIYNLCCTVQNPHQDVEPKLSPKLETATVSSLMTPMDCMTDWEVTRVQRSKHSKSLVTELESMLTKPKWEIYNLYWPSFLGANVIIERLNFLELELNQKLSELNFLC